MEYPFQQKNRGQHQLYGDEKFIHYDWDYYAGDYLVFYPKAVPPSVLQQAFRDTFRHVHGVPASCRGDWAYRRLQAIIRYTHRTKDWNIGRYVEFLKVQEAGKYDRSGCLIPETLARDEKPRDLAVPGIVLPQARRGAEGPPPRLGEALLSRAAALL